MDSVGDIIFILVGTPIALIVAFYIGALLSHMWVSPICKPVFGPFTKGLIAYWAFSSLWIDLSFLVPIFLAFNGAIFTDNTLLFLKMVFWLVGVLGGNIIQKKMDRKQKAIDDMYSNL